MPAPLIPVFAAIGLAVVGGIASDRKKKKSREQARAHTGQRSLPTAHDYAMGTQVPYFGSRRASAGVRRRTGVECPPLPWLEDDVNLVIEDAIVNKGILDVRVLTLMALHEVYRHTDDGRPLQWPTVPEDCVALKLLEQRVRARAKRFVAESEDIEADHLYGKI